MNLLQARQALIDDFMAKGPDSVNRMNTINTFNENNFNQTLVGVSDPTHLIRFRWNTGWMGILLCLYGMDNPSTIDHWAANPLNPWDVDYDGDSDGWYDRTPFDLPAPQGIGTTEHSRHRLKSYNLELEIYHSPTGWSTTTIHGPT